MYPYGGGSNYPHPSNPYGGNYPSNSGPPPPQGMGFGGQAPYGGGGYGGPQGYGQYQSGPPGYGGYHQPTAYGGAGFGSNPAAVPGFTAPPQMQMPPSMQYHMANASFQPMNVQFDMMQHTLARRRPDDPEIAELQRLKQQLMQQQDQERDDEKDREMKELREQFSKLQQQLLVKTAEEADNDAQVKQEMKQRFIDELMRREVLSGTFEDCNGTITPYVQYTSDDPVTVFFQKKKTPVDITGEDWDKEKDAECLRDGIRGWGTDEKKIIRISATRSNAQRQEIYLIYKTMTGRDLIKDLIGDLSGNLRDAMVALYRKPPLFDAYCVKKAIYGLGTDELSLIEILMTRTKEQIKEMKEEYNGITYEKQKDTSVSIEKDIEGDTSGDFKRLLVSASTANRDSIPAKRLNDAVEEIESNGKWTGMFKVNYEKLCDMEKCKRQAQELYDAGEDKWGTDEETFNRIFSVRDMYSLREIYNEYVKLSQRDILNSVDRETSGNFRRGLRAIAQSVKCRPMYFAERLKDAMKGLGTDDTTLIRIVISRSEIDLVQIKQCFLELTKQTLWNYIKNDTSGDYKELLLAIVGKN